MQDQIASFLFLYRSCPLPGLGTLYLEDGQAATNFTGKTIEAAVPMISFRKEEIEKSALLSYLIKNSTAHADESRSALVAFCSTLKSCLEQNRQADIPQIGNLHADEDGGIILIPRPAPLAFLPPVHAERVIHPDTEHAILVGDRETNSTQMTEYYNEEAPKKDRWWIWALILGIIGVLVIIIYANDNDGSALCGNAGKF